MPRLPLLAIGNVLLGGICQENLDPCHPLGSSRITAPRAHQAVAAYRRPRSYWRGWRGRSRRTCQITSSEPGRNRAATESRARVIPECRLGRFRVFA